MVNDFFFCFLDGKRLKLYDGHSSSLKIYMNLEKDLRSLKVTRKTDECRFIL